MRYVLALVLVAAGCSEPGNDFDRPTAVAFDPTTRDVIVTDGYNHARVARFTRDGAFRGDFGERGAGEGQLRTPHGVAVDREGRIYVADRENARVQVFDRDGTLVGIWDSTRVGRPWAIAIGPDGFVYVVDGGDQDPKRTRGGLTKLTTDGRVVARLRTETQALLDGAHAVAVGADGSVYLAESDGKRVRKLVPSTRGK